MSREHDLKTMLREVCLRGLGAVAQPRSAAARSELRQACLRGNAYLRSLAAARQADDLAPQDTRPAPRPPDGAPASPQPAPAFKPRLPYAEDD